MKNILFSGTKKHTADLKFWKGKHYKTKFFAFLESCWFLIGNRFLCVQFLKLPIPFPTYGSGNWLASDGTNRQLRIGEFPQYHSTDKENEQYDDLLNRKFCVFSHYVAFANSKINWHSDFISKKHWKRKYHRRLQPVADGKDASDCKVPWELSRFQHLPSMAKVYLIRNDARYAEEAIWQIEDWINENPFLHGINWTCAMEVAIRACNWMWAWWAFKDTKSWTEEFNSRFLKSMWQHGWYIEKNLENKGGIETNHYLSDVVGLLFIGVMFPQFKDAEKWKKFGVKEIIRCMEEMVHEDGVSFENSTGYHRLVLELFTYSAILCKNNNIELPPRFWRRLERMFDFILHAMRPDGLMPMIGDNDDGRFFILSDYYTWHRFDFRYLLAIGAVLFNRKDFFKASDGANEEACWLFENQELRD